jgi:hypothetical protein
VIDDQTEIFVPVGNVLLVLCPLSYAILRDFNVEEATERAGGQSVFAEKGLRVGARPDRGLGGVGELGDGA